jgi:hypothetical protein
MKTNLVQLEKTIQIIEKLADEVLNLAEKLSKNDNVQPELSIKVQRWYRGARELLIQNDFSGIKEFDYCYNSNNDHNQRSFTDIEKYTQIGTNSYKSTRLWTSETQAKEHFGLFQEYFQKARALFISLLDEMNSKELLMKSELSFAVAADEFVTARTIFNDNRQDETALRVSGFITRIALERHLLTIADARSIEIEVNPKTKKRADINDILTTLKKSGIINSIQKSELESLFTIGNNCAHPKEKVKNEDVDRLIKRAHELSSIIL